MLENLNIPSEVFWRGALLLVAVDAPLVALLAWRIRRPAFQDLRWPLAAAAALFWGIFAGVLVSVFWDPYYRHFYPGGLRLVGLLLLVPAAYGLFALSFHWLALHLPGNAIVTFCLLGGLESLLEHLWGLYGFRIVDLPLLAGASPASILAFAFPEYVLYWCVVLGLAALTQAARRRWLHWQRRAPNPA